VYRFAWEQVKAEGMTLAGTEEPAAFPELAAVEQQGGCRFVGPVSAELRVYPVDGMLEVDGPVSCKISVPCSRCLAEFEQELSSRMQLTLVRDLPHVESEDGEELELSAEDLGMVQVGLDEIDLHQAIAEQLLLELPWHPLCATDCAGLCAQCGANLNRGPCGCHPETGFSRFAALKDFKVDK